jgi:hypothetical protein
MCWKLETAFIFQHIFDQLELFRQSNVFPVHRDWKHRGNSTYLINLNFSDRSGVFPKHMHCKL